MTTKIFDIIKITFTTIGGFLGAILGGVDGLLYALIAIMICDYLTGVFVAINNKKLSSEIGFKGILKKISIFVLVALGYVIDSKVIKQGGVVRTATICFYIANEGISILENCGNLGLPIPQKLKDVLLQIKTDNEKE